jgi:antibiotic biosynthesis monooxygenase (ABM) superfamily enzyme
MVHVRAADRVPPRWLRVAIVVGAGLFIAALLLSAVFEPRIRLLHLLQALIYVAVIVLTRRGSAWGFGGPGRSTSAC